MKRRGVLGSMAAFFGMSAMPKQVIAGPDYSEISEPKLYDITTHKTHEEFCKSKPPLLACYEDAMAMRTTVSDQVQTWHPYIFTYDYENGMSEVHVTHPARWEGYGYSVWCSYPTAKEGFREIAIQRIFRVLRKMTEGLPKNARKIEYARLTPSETHVAQK